MRNRTNDKNQGFTLNAKNCLTAAQTEFIELYAKMIQQLLDPKQNKFTVNGEQIDMQFYFVAAPDSNMSNNWNILKDYLNVMQQ